MTSDNLSSYDVIHVGQYYCDLIFTGLPEMPQIGAEIFGTGLQLGPGGGFNTSYALQRLGLKTGWVCDFGQDFFSQYVLERVRQLGMDTSLFRFHTHDLCAVTAAFSYRHDRGFISYLDHYEPMDLLPYIKTYRPKCVLLGGLCFEESFIDLIETAHSLGARVVMDCQYRDVTLTTPGVIDVLKRVDIFLPNLSEAQNLTGEDQVGRMLGVLSPLAPTVAIKLGEAGAATLIDGQPVTVPGIKVKEVVDTTGAGDCFNAGFLYGYLHEAPLLDCLKYANICGGVSVTGYGVSQAPSAEELEELVAHYAELVEGMQDLIPPQHPLGLTFSCNRK